MDAEASEHGLGTRRGRVHLRAAGCGGPPVLLLHGLGSLSDEILPPFLPAARFARLLAPDRPGYGLSEPLPEGGAGQDGQARTIAALLDRLGHPAAIVVAHSLAAGLALVLAARMPQRVRGLLLVGGFCRPTPHHAMPVLRAAVAPVIGPPIRQVVIPGLSTVVGPTMLRAAMRPDPVPGYLADFPFERAAETTAIETMAAELRAFNACVGRAAPALRRFPGPVRAVHGADDRVAEPDWHLPWLRKVLPQTRVEILPGVGHAPHHARPRQVLRALGDLVRDLASP